MTSLIGLKNKKHQFRNKKSSKKSHNEMTKQLEECTEDVEKKVLDENASSLLKSVDFSQKQIPEKKEEQEEKLRQIQSKQSFVELEDGQIVAEDQSTCQQQEKLQQQQDKQQEIQQQIQPQELITIELRMEEEKEEEYDPSAIQCTSAKPLSQKAEEYKQALTNMICSLLEENKYFNLEKQFVLQTSRNLVDGLCNFFDNSDQLIEGGERVLTLLQKLKDQEEICKRLQMTGFKIKNLLYLSERINQLPQNAVIVILDGQKLNNQLSATEQLPTETKTEIETIQKKSKVDQQGNSSITAEKMQSHIEKKSIMKQSSLDGNKKNQNSKTKQVTFQIDDFNKQYLQISKDHSEVSLKQSKKMQKIQEKDLNQQQNSMNNNDIEQVETLPSIKSDRQTCNPIFFNPEMEYLSIYEGVIDCCDKQISDIKLISSQNFAQLSKMPVSKQPSQKVVNTVHFGKLEEYINYILKNQQNEIVLTCGWLEGSQNHNQQQLDHFGNKLQKCNKAGVIEWNDGCKIYIFSKEQMTSKWQRKIFYYSNLTYQLQSTLFWITIYKRNAQQTTQLLVPIILPKVSNNQQQIQQQLQRQPTAQIKESVIKAEDPSVSLSEFDKIESELEQEEGAQVQMKMKLWDSDNQISTLETLANAEQNREQLQKQCQQMEQRIMQQQRFEKKQKFRQQNFINYKQSAAKFFTNNKSSFNNSTNYYNNYSSNTIGQNRNVPNFNIQQNNQFRKSNQFAQGFKSVQKISSSNVNSNNSNNNNNSSSNNNNNNNKFRKFSVSKFSYQNSNNQIQPSNYNWSSGRAQNQSQIQQQMQTKFYNQNNYQYPTTKFYQNNFNRSRAYSSFTVSKQSYKQPASKFQFENKNTKDNFMHSVNKSTYLNNNFNKGNNNQFNNSIKQLPYNKTTIEPSGKSNALLMKLGQTVEMIKQTIQKTQQQIQQNPQQIPSLASIQQLVPLTEYLNPLINTIQQQQQQIQMIQNQQAKSQTQNVQHYQGKNNQITNKENQQLNQIIQKYNYTHNNNQYQQRMNQNNEQCLAQKQRMNSYDQHNQGNYQNINSQDFINKTNTNQQQMNSSRQVLSDTTNRTSFNNFMEQKVQMIKNDNQSQQSKFQYSSYNFYNDKMQKTNKLRMQ